ncbi:uncharacterized protein LOC126785921 [Argentina anserina]|uniref:uncharacterized protein LOC126785920 n=1 Tax=Argentina anserina TaxID=57926 RepID=UPI00217624C9|nr:uncharacterized protein LOC126785920 [Potentilla anserina]XP_050367559.1 uncharacterized protein LOC126785921 [Potentilla anserina]
MSKLSGRKNVEDEGNKVQNIQRVWDVAKKQLLGTLRKVKKAKPSIFVDDRLSLYLCFGEYGENSEVSYTISSVGFRKLLAAPSPVKLEMVTTFSAEGLPRYMGCGLWGSKIVLGGGAQQVSGSLEYDMVPEIYSIETANDTRVELPKMVKGSMLPMLVEVDSKLYALGKAYNPCFQVFDGNHWSELPLPPYTKFSVYPFTHKHPACRDDVYFAAAERHILLCEGAGSFYFDTAEPEHGWRELQTIFFKPFIFFGTSLIVNDGKQFVHFTFELAEGHHISVHLISYDFTTIKQDHSCVQLPPYLLHYKDDCLGDIPLPNYQLLHLGGNNVCLFLSKLQRSGEDGGKNKMTRCVESVAFTFKVKDNADSSFKVKFLPRTPMLVYDDDDMDVPFGAGQMLGAFIMYSILQLKNVFLIGQNYRLIETRLHIDCSS